MGSAQGGRKGKGEFFGYLSKFWRKKRGKGEKLFEEM